MKMVLVEEEALTCADDTVFRSPDDLERLRPLLTEFASKVPEGMHALLLDAAGHPLGLVRSSATARPRSVRWIQEVLRVALTTEVPTASIVPVRTTKGTPPRASVADAVLSGRLAGAAEAMQMHMPGLILAGSEAVVFHDFEKEG